MSDRKSPPPSNTVPDAGPSAATGTTAAPVPVPEIGGPPGAEPTRFGDWEKNGRCIDF